MSETLTFKVTEIRIPAFGYAIQIDATLPPDVIEFRDGLTGRVLGRITNVGIENGNTEFGERVAPSEETRSGANE